jgi:hypothetical protein
LKHTKLLSWIFYVTFLVVTILTTGGPLQMQVQGTITTDNGGPSSAPPGVDPNKCIPGNECPPVCPEGFIRATPPLNPQLGCLPESITADPGDKPGSEIPPGGCPEGFIRATPPLNPQLGCLPGSETTEHEKTDEENRDSGSTLSAVPEDGEPVDGSEEEGEVPRNDDTDGDRGSR